jgi:protease-4
MAGARHIIRSRNGLPAVPRGTLMSSDPNPVSPGPVRSVQPAPPQAAPRSAAFGCLLALSLLLNFAALLVFVIGCFGLFLGWRLAGDTGEESLVEKHHSGKTTGKDKVAIITLDGIIMEGGLNFVHRQIEQAAKDEGVKAVVLRINSPGGSITASDDLYRRLVELRDGNSRSKRAARPLIVSMASLAASGGYYVAMPGQTLFAERSTITGSIGVYAAFPNAAEGMKKIGVEMIVIKQGEIKDGGSPFKEMGEKERRVWQDMVNRGYNQFLDVVYTGRPNLKRDRGELLAELVVEPVRPGDPPGQSLKPREGPRRWYQAAPYHRYRADGGIWTAEEALELGLIDKIGSLDEAVQAARSAAKLDEDARTIQYEKPKSLSETLLGVKAPKGPTLLEADRLRQGLMPRLWYLAPGCEAAGFLAAAEAD